MSATPKSKESQSGKETAISVDPKPEIHKLPDEENVPLDTAEIMDPQKLSNIEKELDAEIEKLKAELETGPSMKETMDLLHEYNEIKDATQIVLGAMASMHGVTIASLHEEYNLPMGEE